MQLLAPVRRVSDALASRPAVAATLLLICGILFQNSLPLKPVIWLISILLLLAIALWQLRRAWISSPCIAAAIFFLGLTCAQLNSFFFSANEVGLFTAGSERLAELEVRISDSPRVSGGGAEMRKLPPKQIVTAIVTAIDTRSGWTPASGKVSISLEPPLEKLAAGQTIRALGWLSRPELPANPGQFDYAAYDRRQRILATFRITRSEGIQIIHDSGPPPLAWLRQSARAALAAGFTPEHALDAAFLRMLLLGDSDPQINDVREEFYLTGTAYLLSISGLHIAILSAAVLLLLRLMRIRPQTAVWICMLFVGLYAAAALPSQAGVRSLVVCFAAAIGLTARRKTDALQILSTALAAILFFNPADLFDAGFQIGVVAVLGLILFAPHAGLFFRILWSSDDPWMVRQPSLARIAARLAWQTILASSVIWVCVMPLVAYHFQQANPWAVPGGFVLLPVTIVSLIGGAMKIILTLICPWLASWWAAAVGLGPALLRHGIDWLARLPGASISTSPPPCWLWFVYYLLVVLPLMPWRSVVWRRTARCAPVLACLAIIFAPPPADAQMSASPSGQVRLTVLSIGAGQSALVRVQNGENFFLDCGSDTVPDVYTHVIQPYLSHEGVRRIDEIFLSHGDYDHISAAAEIIEAYHVTRVRLTPHFRGHAVGNVAAEALLHMLDTRGPAPTLTSAGDVVDVGASIQFLWPPRDCSMNSNDCGMVFKLHYGGRSILFPADIQVAPELELLKHPELLKADVLVAPHHGSAEVSTLAFIRAISPRFIVCSNDRMLTHKQITFDQIAKPWPVFRTDQYGSIDVTLGAQGQINLSTFNSHPQPNEVEQAELAAAP